MQAVVVSKSLVHFLAQLHTLALCHFMAHYHFSSTGAQEVLLSMRSIHATFLLRTSEHFTAVLSHNLMNVMNSCFFIRLSTATFVNFCWLVLFVIVNNTLDQLKPRRGKEIHVKNIVSKISVIHLLISFYRP